MFEYSRKDRIKWYLQGAGIALVLVLAGIGFVSTLANATRTFCP